MLDGKESDLMRCQGVGKELYWLGKETVKKSMCGLGIETG